MGMIILNGKEYTSMPKDGFPPLIYSLEEREVGVWTDGKPLYCQTVKVEHLTRNGNWQTITHNIANIDKIAHFQGKVYVNTDQAYWLIPSPRAGNTNGYSVFIDRTYIHYINNIHDTNVTEDVSFTIYYTKTTDVAGSGKYTTYGGLTHHYSETEQVIGTWIDGKPIYEKTYSIPSSNLVSHDNDIQIDLTNMDSFIQAYGTLKFTNGKWFTIPDSHWAGEWGIGIYNVSATSFDLAIGSYVYSNGITGNVYVTFRYTKTTD